MQLRKGASADYLEVSFLFLEIVEELGNTRKCWLALAFYLDGKLDAGLADATDVLDVVESGYQAHA